MTAEERKEYNRLSEEGREFYDRYQSMHPDWGHNKLITMSTVCGFQPVGTIGGPDRITIKEILAECVRKADLYMQAQFPRVYPQVREFFIKVGDAIRKAVHVTWQFVLNLFNSL